MRNVFADYYRCPSEFADFGVTGQVSEDDGYFLFRDAVCYGRLQGAQPRPIPSRLPDASENVHAAAGKICLPFDLEEVITNLRGEWYYQKSPSLLSKVSSIGALRNFYYFLRPLLPVTVRKHLQRLNLSGWDKIPFPRWPVDFTVETLMERCMELALNSRSVKEIPFIWFWPDGMSSAAIVTHDVETSTGHKFCDRLMDIDNSFGFKAAFQIVPEKRYEKSLALLARFRARGFEVNIHDLDHDGHLFHSKEQFEKRAVKINHYLREFGARGFRAGAMNRQQRWFGALDLAFDMSVPNVAHLEPQRGGCCTVMPYFIGDIVELPLTTTQDYSLFHILNDYSISLWMQQIDLITQRSGLITILTHPDYLIEQRAQSVYRDLLAHMRRLCVDRNVWAALPGDVEQWWRTRNQMKLVRDGVAWRISGDGCDRARVAYARLGGDRLVYEFAE